MRREQTMALKDRIESLLQPLIDDLGYELVGLELNQHPRNGLLRIYIDEPERGIALEDCERVSQEVSALLDVNDPIKGHYNLEVSSPGLDRPLFTPEQFERFVGQEVKVNVMVPVADRRKFRGRIERVDGDRIYLDQDGQTVEIDHDNVVKARLVPDI